MSLSALMYGNLGRPNFQYSNLCHFAVNQKVEIQLIVLYFSSRKTVARRKLQVIGPGHIGESENTR